MPRVRVKNGPSKGELFDVGDSPLSIGRDATCGIQILDKGASRNHAEIFRIGEMCFIRDLESRNGSYVNDSKIEEELLREGDRIQIGATVLVFESGSEGQGGLDSGLEFSEEAVGNTLELKLEDLSVLNVGEGDGNEAQRLRALYRLGRMIAEAADEQILLDKVLPFVGEQCRADVAYLFTRDSQSGNIVPIGTWAKGGKRSGKISRTIIRRAIQEKRALLTSDAMQDNRFSSRDSIVLKEIHSVICVPLCPGSDLSGVLYLASDNPANVFSEEELELAAAMADQIGLAISHLRIQSTQREHLMSTIRVLVRAAEMKDPQDRGHSERVASYCSAIGKQMRISPEELEHLQLAALLHEIGKLAQIEGLSYDLPEQDADLSSEQRIVRLSLEIAKDMSCYKEIEGGIRYQLERNDGSGPEKVSGKDIPPAARIIAVANTFDRLVNYSDSDKTSGEILKDAVVELGREAGKKFNEDVVKALLIAHRNGSLHGSQPLDSEIEDEENLIEE